MNITTDATADATTAATPATRSDNRLPGAAS